jgi:membrane-bound lytic murein transglycosylase D
MLKYALLSVLVGGLFIAGCSSTTKQSEQVALENVVSQEQQASVAAPPEPEILEIIKKAETHYEEGSAHYEQQRWKLARQEFDLALETLLDADIDAETHYRLSQAYDKLFFKIRKLELEQTYLRGILGEEPQEVAQSTEQLEASLAETQLEDSGSELHQQEADDIFQNSEDTLGEFVIDDSDAEMMKYVKDFTRERSQYRRGMERASQYLPTILEIFKEHHVPTELVFIPLIESNFRVDAVSPASAVGLWQFARPTGRSYGLTINKWVDERRDPEKSARAAAKYLSDLYGMLGDWDLVLAGYYMGEYKVHKAIGKHRTRDIGTLAETRTFGRGAKLYVSRIKAAVYLAKHHEQYGLMLSVNSNSPNYESVQVKKGVSLKTLAKQFGTSYNELRKLNPELRQSKTPPGKGTYSLKVPPGAGTIFLAKNTIAEEQQTTQSTQSGQRNTASTQRVSSSNDAVVYRVRRGDNLSKIAKKYRVDVNLLKKVNNISNVKALQIGQKLKIPASGMSYSASAGPEVITHTIQKGETLGTIAKRYKVKVETLKSYNNIRNERRLQIGQAINVPLPASSVLVKNQSNSSSKPRMFTYRVKRGDSLSKIASTFGVSVPQLQKWNNIGTGTLIYPGSRIKVWY